MLRLIAEGSLHGIADRRSVDDLESGIEPEQVERVPSHCEQSAIGSGGDPYARRRRIQRNCCGTGNGARGGDAQQTDGMRPRRDFLQSDEHIATPDRDLHLLMRNVREFHARPG